jgi:hypothetical protein
MGRGFAAGLAGGFAAAGVASPLPGSGTADLAGALATSALGRWTVNGFLHFGHLIDRPAGGTRESSSSYAAAQFGHEIFTSRPFLRVFEAMLRRPNPKDRAILTPGPR